MSRAIARKVAADLQSASWIREMFEKGRRLKAERGADKVFDLSLGNPNATPPKEYFDALRAVADEQRPELHRYMPNAGFDETRAAVAAFLTAEYGIKFDGPSVIMTSGAAGGLSVAIHAICNPGDEVIVLAPYFPEYRFYVEHAAAHLVVVPTGDGFQPDLDALAGAITSRTAAIIVNTPNNPTGVVYTEASCRGLAKLLVERTTDARPIYLLLDDPYRRIVYGDEGRASPAALYPRALIISSYSKDISIAGERVGYIAVPPEMPERALLLNALTMLNRTLGFVNASATTQRVIARCAAARCDLSLYRKNRDVLCEALASAGYEFTPPGGALYVFPKTPIPDDVAFVDMLVEHGVLTVPGRGFGWPGHIRISFCVDQATIQGALPGFRKAIERARARC
jgi:aspartate aminotransferase